MLLSSVLVALVRYLYTGDLTLDQFTKLADLAADLLWAESMLGLEDTQLRTSIEDLLLGELAREGQEATSSRSWSSGTWPPSTTSPGS